MQRFFRTGVIVAGAALSMLAAGQQGSGNSNPQQIERGKYLVNGVAKCGDCHTPHLPDGKEDTAHLLQGAPIESKPIRPIKWEDHAPAIAGGPRGARWTQAAFSKLLQTGLDTRGHSLDAPMPHYEMSPEDADAVAAYVFNLPKPAPKAGQSGAEHEHQH